MNCYSNGKITPTDFKLYKREGHYPSRVLADKIYRNRENLSNCKEHGIRLSGAESEEDSVSFF